MKLEDLYKYYGRLIDEAINLCVNKNNNTHDSLSSSVRREAAVAYLKSAYFKKYRNELIQDMIKAAVSGKQHNANYYLDNHFYSVFYNKPECALRC
jgi:hypothetical protein